MAVSITLTHPTIKIAGQKLHAVADWNANHQVTADINLGGYNLTTTGLIILANTTDSITGVVYKGADRFIHNFQHPTGSGAVPYGYNTFVGVNAGNFTMGSGAIYSYQASNNTAIGYGAFSGNTLGYFNTAIGNNVLSNNTTGYYNTAIGYGAMLQNISGIANFALSADALPKNTTGNENFAIGFKSLYENITGDKNMAIGHQAMYTNTTGYLNTAVGYKALYNVRPASGAITAFADYSGTVAGTVKATTLYNHGLIGTVANIRISGTINYNGIYTVTVIDVKNFYFTHAWKGTETGWWSKDTQGRYNIGIGYQAGDNITTGSNNLIIGYDVDAPSATADNQLNIGNVIYGNLSTGRIGIGITTPAASALLDLTSTTKALIVTRMTTTQRNALTAVNGMIIYNSTTNAFNFYENGAWVTGSGLA